MGRCTSIGVRTAAIGNARPNLGSRNYRQTTKEVSLAAAKDFARNWYMERCVEDRQRRRGGVPLLGSPVQPLIADTGAPIDGRRRRTPTGPSFEDAAKAFTSEFEVITLGERNAGYVKSKADIVRVHLLPFFGETALEDITAGKVQEYRAHRQTSRIDPKIGKSKKPPRATLHHEIVTLRQVLKTANRKGWIAALPDMSAPYKTSGKVEHRAWFSPEEYKFLYEATRERAKNPPKPRWREVCETFHDYVLFMGNTGLRPDESARLELRDVKIVNEESTGERILEIEVRGKRRVGFCKSMPGAILPFERVRKQAAKTDRSDIGEVAARVDEHGPRRAESEGRPRWPHPHLLQPAAYLYLSAIGADIYQVAKNCRTSVEMIEKFYVRHLKNNTDASAVNVRKAKPPKVAARKKGRDANGISQVADVCRCVF
jgi:hypothetical protein